MIDINLLRADPEKVKNILNGDWILIFQRKSILTYILLKTVGGILLG